MTAQFCRHRTLSHLKEAHALHFGVWRLQLVAALLAAHASLVLSGCIMPHRKEAPYTPIESSGTLQGQEGTAASVGTSNASGGVQDAPEAEVISRTSTAQRSLGIGDVVDIRVFQEPDLTGTYRISEEGKIDYPFCGRIDVNGVSQAALADKITTCLKGGYLKKPQVTVFLKEFHSQKVFVLGQVNKPGTFAFEERMTVVQVISLAGGFAKLASKNSVIVTRRTASGEQKFKVPVENIAEGRHANFTLQPGDIVYVPESFL